MSSSTPRTMWEELEGKSGEEAKNIILQENSNLQVQIIPEDAFVTMDYNENRVRIRVNGDGIVTSPPMTG